MADEKRRWAVNHVTLSGKPDKLKARRRSRPWEATLDPIEEALKQVRVKHGRSIRVSLTGSLRPHGGWRCGVEAARVGPGGGRAGGEEGHETKPLSLFCLLRPLLRKSLPSADEERNTAVWPNFRTYVPMRCGNVFAPPSCFPTLSFHAPSSTTPFRLSPFKVATGGGVDLFAYDRTPEEALEQLRKTKGLTKDGSGGDNDGKPRDDGLSKSGTLEQVMARLQLQSHINQVRTRRRARYCFCMFLYIFFETGAKIEVAAQTGCTSLWYLGYLRSGREGLREFGRLMRRLTIVDKISFVL